MPGFELYTPRQPRHRRTWTAAVIVLGAVFLLIAGLIPAIPYIIERVQMMARHPGVVQAVPPPALTVWMLFVPDVFLIAFILAWVWGFERRPPAGIGFNARSLHRFGRGYLMGAGFLLAVVCLITMLGGFQIDNLGFLVTPSLVALLPILGYVALFMIQGSGEEVLMRGWLMQIIASRHGLVWAVILNALIFSALHFFNMPPSQTLYAGLANIALFGLFISLYAIREQSLWGVCGWHAAWNWFQGVGLGLPVSGLKLHVVPLFLQLSARPDAAWWLSGGDFGPEASVITSAVLLAAIAWLLRDLKARPPVSF